jgi:hypothetical protein
MNHVIESIEYIQNGLTSNYYNNGLTSNDYCEALKLQIRNCIAPR